jgi:hypothetical protein
VAEGEHFTGDRHDMHLDCGEGFFLPWTKDSFYLVFSLLLIRGLRQVHNMSFQVGIGPLVCLGSNRRSKNAGFFCFAQARGSIHGFISTVLDSTYV